MNDIDYQPDLIENPMDSSGLNPERRNTVRLLGEVLGQAIADRYLDFCKLVFGHHGLQASVPVAAHMLRELDSIFRGALEDFAGKPPEPDATEIARMKSVREAIAGQGYDPDTVNRSISALAPRDSHKATIKKIIAWLGFAENSRIATDWLSVSSAHRMAHERKYNRSLQVDDAFRQKWAVPFDRVIRDIALALQMKFAALVQRVDMLAAEVDVDKALSEFDKQNIGSSSVQRHFFTKIQRTTWLPKLIERGMIAEPPEGPPDENGNPTFRDWPVGLYLLGIVDSEDSDTLLKLSGVVQAVAGSENPEVRRLSSCIIAKLPTDLAAPLIGVIIGWLPSGEYSVTAAAVDLLKRLTAEGRKLAALELATALFDVSEGNGKAASVFPQHMYEHHLLEVHAALTDALGLDALKLFVGFLFKASLLEGKIRFDPYCDYTSIIIAPLLVDDRRAYDAFGALTEVTIKCAIRLMEREDVDGERVLDVLLEKRCRLTERMAILALARKPETAPERAERFLLEQDFHESDSMRHEYAALAIAWFANMPPERQAELLTKIDGIPARYIDGYRKRLAAYEQREATADDETRFVETIIRDASWYWRSVLPADRQMALAQTVEKWGEPDAWMKSTALGPEKSRIDRADFKETSVEEIARILATPSAADEEGQRAESILLSHFRSAVQDEPLKFSAGAMHFAALRAPYVQSFVEGLRSSVQNKNEIDWSGVFELVKAILPQIASSSYHPSKLGGLQMLAKEIGDLISAGLRSGGENIPLYQDETILEAIVTFERIVPPEPEYRDFEAQFSEFPYSTAQQTLLGSIAELHFLRVYWLSRHPASEIREKQRDALATISGFAAFAERAFRFDGNNGLVLRAVFGRYLNWLAYFGEAWVKENFKQLFPDDERLSEAAWSSHLLYDGGPAKGLTSEMVWLYQREIATFSLDALQRDHRPERFGDYVMCLYLTGSIEGDLIRALWNAAPPSLLKHMIWFLGRELRKSNLAPEIRARCEDYWEARITAAEASSAKERFSEEIGAIGGWMIDSGSGSEWFLSQMLRSLHAGFALDQTYSVMNWAAKNLSEHVDGIVQLTAAMVSNPHVETWAFIGQEATIRAIIEAGSASQSAVTRSRSQSIISIMASKGNTGFLDLMDAD